MPPISILVLALILAAFCTFAVALAYAERQTRHLKRERQTALPPQPREAPANREHELAKAA